MSDAVIIVVINSAVIIIVAFINRVNSNRNREKIKTEVNETREKITTEVKDLHTTVNGKMDQMLKDKEEKGHAQGVKDEKEDQAEK